MHGKLVQSDYLFFNGTGGDFLFHLKNPLEQLFLRCSVCLLPFLVVFFNVPDIPLEPAVSVVLHPGLDCLLAMNSLCFYVNVEQKRS